MCDGVASKHSDPSRTLMRHDDWLSQKREPVVMDRRSVEKLRNELERLMGEQIESLRAQTFGGLNEEQFREQAERLKRIREVSADFLAALKRTGG
jgi:hypothetical protein